MICMYAYIYTYLYVCIILIRVPSLSLTLSNRSPHASQKVQFDFVTCPLHLFSVVFSLKDESGCISTAVGTLFSQFLWLIYGYRNKKRMIRN